VCNDLKSTVKNISSENMKSEGIRDMSHYHSCGLPGYASTVMIHRFFSQSTSFLVEY